MNLNCVCFEEFNSIEVRERERERLSLNLALEIFLFISKASSIEKVMKEASRLKHL